MFEDMGDQPEGITVARGESASVADNALRNLQKLAEDPDLRAAMREYIHAEAVHRVYRYAPEISIEMIREAALNGNEAQAGLKNHREVFLTSLTEIPVGSDQHKALLALLEKEKWQAGPWQRSYENTRHSTRAHVAGHSMID